MTTYYKATRPDGTDFYTGTVNYAAALKSGETLVHPSTETTPDEAWTYFSVSTTPGETLIGGYWPCRLFRVDADPGAASSQVHPYKRCTRTIRVLEELPAWMALGPNGEAVSSFLGDIYAQFRALGTARITAWIAAARVKAPWDALDDAWDALDDALNAARNAAMDAALNAALLAALDSARDAAWKAALDATRSRAWNGGLEVAWGAAWITARDTVWALVARDRITPEQFDALTHSWRELTGKEL